MAIASFADYIPTLDLVIGHWAAVNDLSVLTVPVDELGIVRGDLIDLRGALDAKKTQLQGLLNDLEISRVMLNQAREAATARISEFNRRVRAQFPNARQFAKLPAVPAPTSGRGAFLAAMDEMKGIWARINVSPATATFSPPLLLQGGLTVAAFATSRTAMDAAFSTRATADSDLGLGRGERDELQKKSMRIMVGYRAMVEALYPADSGFVLTLPRLTPLPGHTPDPVVAAAGWNAAAAKAEITWEASPDPTLQDYQLRGVPGPDYAGDDATVLHTFSPADPRSFLTGSGFAIPGAAMSYKLYVRLNTGNEAGSAAMTVARPG